MANFAGYLVSPINHIGYAPESANLANDPPPIVVTEYEVPTARRGSFTDNRPVDVSHVNAAGYMAGSFRHDFYYRVHLLPKVVDLGNVVSQQVVDIEVWNAWFVVNELQSISESTDGGVSFVGPIPAPTAFGPLENRVYQLTVDTAGPPNIEVMFLMSFVLDSVVLSVTGKRVVTLIALINWDDGILERYSWLTDIITTYDGGEQRVKLISEPRREIEAHLQAVGLTHIQMLESMLAGWQARAFSLPFWPDYYRLTADLPQGSTQLTGIDTTDSEFYVGGTMMFWANEYESETVEIAAMTTTSLTFALPTQGVWPTGTKYYSCKFAMIQQQQQITRPTRHVLDMKAKLIVTDNAGGTAADYPTVYGGYGVLDYVPNEVEPVEEEYIRSLRVLDPKTYKPAYEDPIGYTSHVRKVSFLAENRTKRRKLKQWLYAREGRYRPFWMPSWNHDFTMTRVITDAAQAIYIKWCGYKRYVNLSVGRNYLMVETVTGAKYYRKIVGCNEESVTEEVLNIDAPLGVTLSPSQIKRISYLNLARLESDTVEIHHLTDTVTTANIMVRTVKQ